MTNKTVGEYVEVKKLSNHPKNPRHNDFAVDEIASSIRRFGFTSPIIANRDGVVLCGNTRLKASRKLGLDVVPVVYVDLTPTDEELLMIADNKLAERSEWNTEALSELLTELDSNGVNLNGLGFQDDELTVLLEQDILFDDIEPIDETDFLKTPKLCPHCGGEI